MNQHPVELLEPVFRWLDGIIRDQGLYIYMAIVWLSPFLIAWSLSGGLWRRPPRRRIVKVPPIIEQTKVTPPPLPTNMTRESQPEWPQSSNDDTQSFAA